jgi:hypothetical protein
MLAKVYSCAVIGLDGALVEVEVDTANGLPSFVDVVPGTHFHRPVYGKAGKDRPSDQMWMRASLTLSPVPVSMCRRRRAQTGMGRERPH